MMTKKCAKCKGRVQCFSARVGHVELKRTCESCSEPVPCSTLAVLIMMPAQSWVRQNSIARYNRLVILIYYDKYFDFSFYHYYHFIVLSASSRYSDGRGFEGISLPGLCYKGINFKIDIQPSNWSHWMHITSFLSSQEMSLHPLPSLEGPGSTFLSFFLLLCYSFMFNSLLLGSPTIVSFRASFRSYSLWRLQF